MKIAIIGAGLIGRKRAAAKDPKDTILGFYDIERKTAESAVLEFGGSCFTSVDHALSSVGPGDAVIIATSHDYLASIAQTAVDTGCHIFLEKPGARSFDELDTVSKYTKASQVVAIGYNHRFHPGLIRLKTITESKCYGELLSVRARYGHGGRPGYETEWRADKSLSGGGELLDQGSHLIDLTRYIGGRFDLLTSHIDTLKWDMNVEDNAWMIGSTGLKGVASLHASWTEWKNIFSYEAFFDVAKVEVFGLGGSYGPESVIESLMENGYGPPLITTTQFPPGDQSWSLEWQDFKHSTRSSDLGQGARIEDAMAVLKVISKVYHHANI